MPSTARARTPQTFRSNDEAAGWLGAFIDGEGCVYFGTGVNERTGKRWTHRRVVVTVTDPELIDAMAAACDLLGIRYSCSDRPGQDPTRKHRWTCEITAGHALRRFAAVVTLRHPGKVEKLAVCLASFQHAGRCSGCDMPYDQRTVGCGACSSRHGYRNRERPDGLLRRVG